VLGDGIGRGVPVLFSGTPSSSRGRGPEQGRNTCHWIEVDETVVRVERLEWSAERGGFVGMKQDVLNRRRADG
jgi:hypothetical protein